MGKNIEDYKDKIGTLQKKFNEALNSNNPEGNLYRKNGFYSELVSLYYRVKNEGIINKHLEVSSGVPFDF